MKALSIDQVSMVFTVPGGDPVHALREVSLHLEPGELVSVLGPSGCGKTTLLNIVAGFLSPTSGRVLLEDSKAAISTPVEGPGKDRPLITNRTMTEITGPGADRGMVFQQGALFEWMSVEKNVAFGPDTAGKSKEETHKIVQNLLEIVGLKDFNKTPVYRLSGGMQQRVALARCLANNPEVILMDEPLGALDALTREKMQGLVLELWKKTGTTIILITHSVEEALFLGQRLIVMAPRPGRIEKEYFLPFAERGLTMTPRDVKADPEFIARREEILSMIWEMEEQIMGGN